MYGIGENLKFSPSEKFATSKRVTRAIKLTKFFAQYHWRNFSQAKISTYMVHIIIPLSSIQLTGYSGTLSIPPQICHQTIPCVSVLISHLLLHLSISKHLNGRPPLLSISQLTHRKLDSRKSFTIRNWYKLTSKQK